MKGHWISYSADELAWLYVHRTLPIQDYAREFSAAFGRQDASAGNLHALRKRKGWKTGRTGCFSKGDAPHNKGKPCAPGAGGLHPNARKSHFAKGGRTGKAALLYKPVGTERLNKDGYRERKIHDGMPLQSRWRLLHLVEWEAINGPIPAGMALKCLSEKANTAPSNWELVPRAILPRLNGGRGKKHIAYDEAPEELKPAIMAVARLDHAAKRRTAA